MEILVDDAAFAHILRRYGDRSSRYGAGLSSHVPMALDALARLGAPADRLIAFAEGYVEQHAVPPADDAECARRAEISLELRGGRRTPVLHRRLSPLFAQTAGDAFHGLIRAAYAVQRDDDDELAAALAAWELNGPTLDVAPAPGAPQLPVVDAFERLEPAYDAVLLPAGTLISKRMRTVAASPVFLDALAAAPPASAARDLQRAAGAAFGATRNFVALHIMTASHALDVLAAHVADPDAAYASMWPSIAAAWIVAGAPATPDEAEAAAIRDAAPPAWIDTIASALTSDDEHVIKAVYTARELEARSGDRIFRWAAARYIPVPERRGTG